MNDHVSKPEKVTGAETGRSARVGLGIRKTDSGVLTHGAARMRNGGVSAQTKGKKEKRIRQATAYFGICAIGTSTRS